MPIVLNLLFHCFLHCSAQKFTAEILKCSFFKAGLHCNCSYMYRSLLHIRGNNALHKILYFFSIALLHLDILQCTYMYFHSDSCNLLLLHICHVSTKNSLEDQTFLANFNQQNVFDFVHSKPFHTKFQCSQSCFGVSFPAVKAGKVRKFLSNLLSYE